MAAQHVDLIVFTFFFLSLLIRGIKYQIQVEHIYKSHNVNIITFTMIKYVILSILELIQQNHFHIKY